MAHVNQRLECHSEQHTEGKKHEIIIITMIILCVSANVLTAPSFLEEAHELLKMASL